MIVISKVLIFFPLQERLTMIGGTAPVEEKLNNQETASILKQRDNSEGTSGACGPESSSSKHDKNIYQPTKVKNINEKQELKGAYKDVENGWVLEACGDMTQIYSTLPYSPELWFSLLVYKYINISRII